MTDRLSPLAAEHLTLGYDQKMIINDLSIAIPAGEITVIIGPNACGKSTLLRTLSRLMTPQSGRVLLNDRDIKEYATKAIARQLGLLPQSPTTPAGITVRELVFRGRYPWQSLFSRPSIADQQAVEQAMKATHIESLADQSEIGRAHV